jgi:hypothetical protein
MWFFEGFCDAESSGVLATPGLGIRQYHLVEFLWFMATKEKLKPQPAEWAL